MANSTGSNIRNSLYSGKHALLPPKSPFPSISPAYADYALSGVIGPKAVQKPREGNIHHQRTSSESLLVDEQPSWLDDLLNEPETPVCRRHRRSSSDSYAYIDVINASSTDYAAQDEYRYKHLVSVPSWGSQDFDYHKDTRHAPFYTEVNSVKPKSWAWESPMNALPHPSNLPSAKENFALQNSGSPCAARDTDGIPSTASEKLETAEAGPHDPKSYSDKKDNIQAKHSASENDTKRAKQQFAQRSRVRKLQYIAELERNVQALQAEGTEVSAELEFLNQQNLILSMENDALKQRLESLAKEQLIKCMEHEVLEREIGRLRSLYLQQQQQQPPLQPQKQPSSSRQRTNGKDLDSQFANLSLKHKDANSGHDPVTGPLHI